MRVASSAIICIVFLLSLVTSAQTYSVRVTFNTNLRASYSLNTRIVHTAAAGTTLGVSGSHEKWLKIDWQGQEVWLADWVPMTRVDGQQAPSDINNCCFVDRQCQADHEWIAGYWAYQNNQCGGPATPVTAVSTPMTTTAPDQANNCCFTGWQCNTESEWLKGFHAFQNNRCEHRGISIEGPPGFVRQVQAGLDILRAKAPSWYDYVTRGLDRVKQDMSQGRVYADVNGRTMVMDFTDQIPTNTTWNHHTTFISLALVHEACHVTLYEAGQTHSGLEGERACMQKEEAAILEINPNSSWLQHIQQVLATIDDPAHQWWN